ncbi:MAG: hypothetical protein R3F53_19490 [Gammaproteobacteria bacterium]
MLSWDGHNEYRNGRTTSKNHPEGDLVIVLRHIGELWSSTMMQI